MKREKTMYARYILLLLMAFVWGCGGSGTATLSISGRVTTIGGAASTFQEQTITQSCQYNCDTTISSATGGILLSGLSSSPTLQCDLEGTPVTQDFAILDTDVDCGDLGDNGSVEVTCSPVGSGVLNVNFLAGEQGFSAPNCGEVEVNVAMTNQLLGLPEQTVDEIVDLLLLTSCPTLAFLEGVYCDPPPEEPDTFCSAVDIAQITLECAGGS